MLIQTTNYERYYDWYLLKEWKGQKSNLLQTILKDFLMTYWKLSPVETRPSNHILTLIALENLPFPYKDSMWNTDDLPSLQAKLELNSRFIFAIS